MLSYTEMLAAGVWIESAATIVKAEGRTRVEGDLGRLVLRRKDGADTARAREAIAERVPIVRALLAKQAERIATPRWGLCEVCGLGMESYRGGWCPACRAALQKIRDAEQKEVSA